MVNFLEKIDFGKKMPILFIGSGISKRYLQNYPVWDALLERISKKIGLDSHQYSGIKGDISSKFPSISDGERNQKIASELRQIFFDKIKKGDINISEIFNSDEEGKIKANNNMYFHYLVSKEFSNYSLTENPQYFGEIALFRQAVKKSACLFTTNYDTFLEETIMDKKAQVFSSNEMFFYKNDLWYGQIFKIHGSCLDPKSMIICEEDFQSIEHRQQLFSAKLINALMDFPIIFLGYSFNDESVNKILEDFVNCFSDEIVHNLQRRMVYIEWKKGESDLIFGEKRFGKHRSIELTTIQTDNFGEIFSQLCALDTYATPWEIRRFKSLCSRLISQVSSGEKKKYTIIRDTDIPEEKTSQIVIAFGSIEEKKTEETNVCENDEHILYQPGSSPDFVEKKGLLGLTKKDLFQAALFQKKMDYSIVVKDWYDQIPTNREEFLPVFYLLKESGMELSTTSDRFQKNYLEKKRKFSQEVLKMESENDPHIEDIKRGFVPSRVSSKNPSLVKVASLALLGISRKSISRDQLMIFLQDQVAKTPSRMDDSYFKKMICVMDFF